MPDSSPGPLPQQSGALPENYEFTLLSLQYSIQCAKIDLNLGIKIEPDTAGADSTVYCTSMSDFCLQKTGPNPTWLGFHAGVQIMVLLGQCQGPA